MYPSTTTNNAGSTTAGAPLSESSACTSPSPMVDRSMTRKQSRVPTATGVDVDAMPFATTSRFQDPGGMSDGTSMTAVTVAVPVRDAHRREVTGPEVPDVAGRVGEPDERVVGRVLPVVAVPVGLREPVQLRPAIW